MKYQQIVETLDEMQEWIRRTEYSIYPVIFLVREDGKVYFFYPEL